MGCSFSNISHGWRLGGQGTIHETPKFVIVDGDAVTPIFQKYLENVIESFYSVIYCLSIMNNFARTTAKLVYPCSVEFDNLYNMEEHD